MPNRFLARWIVAACLVCAALAVAQKAEALEPQPALGRTLLFVDDHDVLYRSGTRRELHPAERRGPVIVEDKPWEIAIGWSSIYRDRKSGKYQLWYQSYAGTTIADKRLQCVVCYAESDDGVTFRKPALDLFPFGDTAKTNIVLIGSGLHGDRYCNSVLVDDRETDPNRRYKMAFYDWGLKDGRLEAGLCLAFSPDGVRWTKHGDGPLYATRFGARGLQPPLDDEDAYLETPVKGRPVRKEWRYPMTMSDAVDVFYDPRRETYAIYGKAWMDSPIGGGAWKHGLARVESKDLLTWSKAEFLLGPDDRDSPDLEFHTSPVFFYNEMYFSPNQILDRRRSGTMYAELMTSRDGSRWEREFRDRPFIANGPAGEFDGGCILSNNTPIVLDDEIRFYYGAYSSGAVGGGTNITGPEQRSGVGLAVIPRDRFAGIRPLPKSEQPTLRKPVENIGQITLRPVDLTGCTALTVNADAAKGAIRVEVLNADGYRMRGFTQEDCKPITGDSLRHAVAWNQKKLADLPPGRYMLRLHLDNSAVYAVTYR